MVIIERNLSCRSNILAIRVILEKGDAILDFKKKYNEKMEYVKKWFEEKIKNGSE